MASGGAVAAAIAVFAVLVLSSLGNPETAGPLCSTTCGFLCTTKCTDEIFNTCRSYCENPLADRQSCERQVFQACTVSSCCNSTCSRDCILDAKNGCQFVHDTSIKCQSCRGGILQYCPPACYSSCNSTCVKK